MSIQTRDSIEAVGLSRVEAVRLMSSQNERLVATLKAVPAEEWGNKTDCDPWTVKDIAAHVLGWAESVGSVGEFRRQLVGGMKRKAELGNLTDAINQVQVDDRSHLSPQEILERLEASLPRFERFRHRAGLIGKAIPLYESSLLGRTNLAYLVNTIYTRDAFMHRIDITRATTAELHLGRREQRLIEDVLADWSKRSGAAVTVHLDGPAGGSYRLGTGAIATIEGDAIDMARVLGGRGRVSSLRLFGNVPAAESWLAKGCPF